MTGHASGRCEACVRPILSRSISLMHIPPLWLGGCSARLWVKTSSLKGWCVGRSDLAAEQDNFERQTLKSMINFMSLQPGAKVPLVSDAMAEVVSNPRDGM